MYYICENGISVTVIYLFKILIKIMILLYIKSAFYVKA